MSTWKQTGPATWIVGCISGTRELDEQTILDMFNTTSNPGATTNSAISVEDIDQFYTVEIDRDVFEVEAAVTFTRRYDHPNHPIEGLDT